ncbi:MAG TPA: LptF/LptG family permease, partial [Legionellaceae bacterium]|nr:LptF/LptG family permease [Legionellaceae bacterium]
EMTLWELRQFLLAQKLTHQNVRNYQLGYWQRMTLPVTTMVMMLLAIPFIFGPLRSSTMGSKLMIGAMVGFGFYILNRFCGSLSQIYQFSAVIAAIGPTLICATLGAYLMRRAR